MTIKECAAEKRGFLLDICFMRLEGCRYKQIAEKYGVSENDIRTMLSEALFAPDPPQVSDPDICSPSLRRCMAERGWTAERFAEQYSLDADSFRSQLCGASELSLEILRLLMHTFGLTASQLLEGRPQGLCP